MFDVTQNFCILHDNGSIKCLIGQGTLSTCIKSSLGEVENVNVEYLKLQTKEWISQRQLKILEIAEKMFTLDISKVVKRCEEASLHNQSLMKAWNSKWFATMNNEFKIVQHKLNLLSTK